MIYFMADIHLTKYNWTHRKDIEGDSYRALQEACSVIIEDTAADKSVIIAGDIFDTKRVDGESLLCFFTNMKRLWDLKIPVYYIQGNHDLNTTPIPDIIQEFIADDLLIHIHDKEVTIDGFTIRGLDYMPRADLLEAIEVVPACDYLVLHCAFEHLLGFEGAYQLTLDDLPSHVQNVLVGDIHIPDVTKTRKGVCVSPGPLHACQVSQDQTKCIVKISEDKPEFVPLPNQRCIFRYVVKDIAQCSEVESEIAEILTRGYITIKPIIDIKYAIDLSEEMTTLIAKYANDCLFFIKGSAQKELAVEEAAIYERTTLFGCLASVMDPEEESEKYDFMQELLEGDAQAVIDKKIEEVTI